MNTWNLEDVSAVAPVGKQPTNDGLNLKYREGTAMAHIFDQLRTLELRQEVYLDLTYRKYENDGPMTAQAARVIINKFKDKTGREFWTRVTSEGLLTIRRK